MYDCSDDSALQQQAQEDAYQMFSVLMDGFESERKAWETRQSELQELLRQATNVSGYKYYKY